MYLTATRIAALIQEAVKKVRPGISAKDLSKYSAHSLGVWACVLLDKSRQEPQLHPKVTLLDGQLLPNVPPQHENHSGCTLQSPESIKPGNFDAATCTACWHHAERTYEWRHCWCRYGQILLWNGLNRIAFLIFITNDSLDSIHKFIRIWIPLHPNTNLDELKQFSAQSLVGLGMCLAWWGWKVPGIYQEEAMEETHFAV